MSKATLNVPDISCGHCEATITKALNGRPGVHSVQVDIPGRKVLLDYDESQLNLDQVRAVLAEEDYPVASTD
jgi:copper chaperone